MPNSYSKFSYQDIEDLGIQTQRGKLFDALPFITPSDFLIQCLEMGLKRPLATEKAKSEHLIVPVLNELVLQNNDQITFFSGYQFDIDKQKGLKGHCDFLLSKDAQAPVIREPVISIVEAKHENIDTGIPQCIAQMYAAELFNAAKNQPQKAIYGCVTIGLAWNFIRLENNIAIIDTDFYYLNNLPQLLGVWQHIIQNFMD
jgi:hypothetical protein